VGDGVIQQKRDYTKLCSLIKITIQTSAKLLGQCASRHSSGAGLFNKVLRDLKKYNDNKSKGEGALWVVNSFVRPITNSLK
jgi:hypothetical protein